MTIVASRVLTVCCSPCGLCCYVLQAVLWFGQTFPFAQQYAASWSAAQLDGEALMMLDDEGLRDDIPIGVRAHRGIILKKIDALRTKAAGNANAIAQAATVPMLTMGGPAGLGGGGGQSEALAVAKRELGAMQQENAALREALAGDVPSPSSAGIVTGTVAAIPKKLHRSNERSNGELRASASRTITNKTWQARVSGLDSMSVRDLDPC